MNEHKRSILAALGAVQPSPVHPSQHQPRDEYGRFYGQNPLAGRVEVTPPRITLSGGSNLAPPSAPRTPEAVQAEHGRLLAELAQAPRLIRHDLERA